MMLGRVVLILLAILVVAWLLGVVMRDRTGRRR